MLGFGEFGAISVGGEQDSEDIESDSMLGFSVFGASSVGGEKVSKNTESVSMLGFDGFGAILCVFSVEFNAWFRRVWC